MKSAFISLIIFGLVTCKEKPTTKSTIAALNNYLSKYYLLSSMKTHNIKSPDSLRGAGFYSPSLLEAKEYRYDGRVTDSVNSSKVHFEMTMYEYSSVDAAKSVVGFFETDKKRRMDEGFYGPLGKDFQYFLQAKNYLIHLEAGCQYSNEEEWLDLKDSLTQIVVQNLGKTYKDVIKPCE